MNRYSNFTIKLCHLVFDPGRRVRVRFLQTDLAVALLGLRNNRTRTPGRPVPLPLFQAGMRYNIEQLSRILFLDDTHLERRKEVRHA